MDQPSNRFRPVRLLAVLCLALYALYSTFLNGFFVHQLWNPDLLENNPVSKWEKRLKPVLDRLPPDVKLVGYVADWDLPGIEYNLVDQDAEYVLTQYTLAPRMVQPGFEQEWIVGNFVEPGFRDWLKIKLGSYKLFEFGRGIYLIHRLSP